MSDFVGIFAVTSCYKLDHPHEFLTVSPPPNAVLHSAANTLWYRITKPEVRSVRLLGSWDNFSKQYVLERDVEVGPGYWKGCHIFTDMIGHTPDNDEWRSGGLKMGSTYWYYVGAHT